MLTNKNTSLFIVTCRVGVIINYEVSPSIVWAMVEKGVTRPLPTEEENAEDRHQEEKDECPCHHRP